MVAPRYFHRKGFEIRQNPSYALNNRKRLKHRTRVTTMPSGCELQRLLSGVLSIFQDLNNRLQRTPSDLLLISPSPGEVSVPSLSYTDKLCDTLQRNTPNNGISEKQNSLFYTRHNHPRSTRAAVAYQRQAEGAISNKAEESRFDQSGQPNPRFQKKATSCKKGGKKTY